MNRFSTEDIILANRITKFLHATLGQEDKLWQQAARGKITIFSIAERNAFRSTLRVFDGDNRITILEEAEHGEPIRSTVGGECPTIGAS